MNIKIINPKIGLYQENSNTYMSLDATVTNYNDVEKVSIPKIDFSDMLIELIEDRDYSFKGGVKNMVFYQKRCIIQFPVVLIDDVYFTLKCREEDIKEMSKEEIEKELGYKVKIV